MGIPYAIPPVGERRFRPAEPVAASNETIEAYYLGPRYVPIASFPMRC
jgi:carboxylesterase type B